MSCIAFRGFAGDDRELRDCERTRGRDLHAGSVRSDVCVVLGAACKEESHRRRVGRLINFPMDSRILTVTVLNKDLAVPFILFVASMLGWTRLCTR